MNRQSEHEGDGAVFVVHPEDLGPLLVDQLHLQATSFSPFAATLADYAPGSGTVTEDGKALGGNDSFLAAAAVLARPDLRLDALFGGGMRPLGSLRAYAAKRAGDMMVAVAPGDGEWDIRLFDAGRDAAAWVAQQLGTAAPEGEPNMLTPPCSLSTLVAVFHTIDMFRRCAYQDMLEFRRSPDPVMTPQEFRSVAGAGIRSQDVRWLLPSLLVLVPDLAAQLGTMADDGLEQAVKRGFLVGTTRAGSTDPVLLFGEAGRHMGAEFLQSWVGSVGFTVDVMTQSGTRTLHRGYVASTGLANHWFRFEEKEGVLDVNHQPLSQEQYAQKLGDLLLSAAVVDRQADAAGPFVKPGNAAAPGRRAKTATGRAADSSTAQPAAAGLKFCPGCGTPVKPGAKFCTVCGRPLTPGAGGGKS
ncbi:MAG TPA: zinc ribbon domain-containing protein [Candidatus Cryosericum sp.]|nr:zinc ribbon domain-containing protein [Candidatus Cryosericum sp.]